MKSTPAGDIPVDWECLKIGQLCDFSNGNGFGPSTWSEHGLPIIRIQNLNGSEKFNYFSGETKDKWLITPGTLLFAWAGSKGASFGPTVWQGPTGVLNQHIFKITPNKDVNQQWLYLAFHRVTEEIERKAHGFKSTLLHVSKSDITNKLIAFPPLPEQHKIAEILGTWDRAIETQQQLIDSLTRRKKALMQQLLTGKTRLPGFEDEWEEMKLSDIFSRVSTKNKDGHTQVVTISAQDGLICQQDYFNKQIASKVLDNYFVLKKGQFAYNKSYSKGYPMGAIKRLNRYDHGVVTTLYICFELKSEDDSHSDFWEHYFESGALNRGLTRIAHEGGRAHGLLNVTPKDFFELKIQEPSLNEQKAIAQVLTTADSEIKLHTTHLNSLRTQKRGLMQQLLTGKIRVTL